MKHWLAIASVFTAMTSTVVEAKVLDLSTRTDASGTYEVAFCARPSPQGSIPGHMFVSFSHTDPAGERDFMAIGHTVNAGVGPAAATWSYFGSPVGGHLGEERYTSVKQNCLDVVVNREDYDRAKAFADDPLSNLGVTPSPGIVFENYKLGADDCISFAIQVANSLSGVGLMVPTRQALDLPMAYELKLISAN